MLYVVKLALPKLAPLPMTGGTPQILFSPQIIMGLYLLYQCMFIDLVKVRVTWQRISMVQNIRKSIEIHKLEGLNRSTDDL